MAPNVKLNVHMDKPAELHAADPARNAVAARGRCCFRSHRPGLAPQAPHCMMSFLGLYHLTQEEKAMDCPVCGDKLKAIEKYGVEVDVCPGCKGVWLDRGEIEKILAADSGDQAPSGRNDDRDRRDDDRDRRDDDRDRDRHDDRSKRKRKGSLLGDILGGFSGGDD